MGGGRPRADRRREHLTPRLAGPPARRARQPTLPWTWRSCMKHRVSVSINGKTHEDEVEPRLLLVHYLRDVAGLTGTHVGCDTSQCGACTVLVDGKAVKSCTLFAV